MEMPTKITKTVTEQFSKPICSRTPVLANCQLAKVQAVGLQNTSHNQGEFSLKSLQDTVCATATAKTSMLDRLHSIQL